MRHSKGVKLVVETCEQLRTSTSQIGTVPAYLQGMETDIHFDPMAFRVMGSGRPVHAFEHISALKSHHPEARVVIGCDSQNYSQRTVYVTTIVLRFPRSGAHVIYLKESVSRIPDMWTKLWGETQRSVSLAFALENACGIHADQIDLDYNRDPAFASHKLLGPSEGYIKSLGFQAAAKPEMLMAVWAANALCH